MQQRYLAGIQPGFVVRFRRSQFLVFFNIGFKESSQPVQILFNQNNPDLLVF